MATSSLAAQLSKSVSLNASLYVDRSRRKPTESYLFTSREAEQHDFHSLYALGVNGITRLKTLDPKFAKYEATLFSDSSRDLDRTLQSEAQNIELDKMLYHFLRDLGPYLLETPTGKVLEWVVRRFRIHEFNVDSVMGLFLPYHETPHFTKMLSILHIENSPLWSFLQPVKKAATTLPRSILVDEMLSRVEVAHFVIRLLSESLDSNHRTLIGFVTSITVEYVSRLKDIHPETATFMVTAMNKLFGNKSDHDSTLAGCVGLATLSQRFSFNPKPLELMLSNSLYAQRHMQNQSVLPFIVAILAPQEQLADFTDSVADSILSLPGGSSALVDALKWAGSEKLVLPMLQSIISRLDQGICLKTVESLLASPTLPRVVTEQTLEKLLKEAAKETLINETLFQVLVSGFQRHGAIFSDASTRVLNATDDEEMKKNIEQVVRSLALPSAAVAGDYDKLVLHTADANVTSRITAVRKVLDILSEGNISSQERDSMIQALKGRLVDIDVSVIEELYSKPEALHHGFTDASFVESLSRALSSAALSRVIIRQHIAFVATHISSHSPTLLTPIFERICFPYLLFSKPRQKTVSLVWESLAGTALSKYELFNGCLEIISSNKPEDATSLSVDEMAGLNMALAARIAGALNLAIQRTEDLILTSTENIVSSNSFKQHLDMLMRLLHETDGHTLSFTYLIIRYLLSQLSGEHQVDTAQLVLSSMGLKSLDHLRDVMANVSNLQEIISDESLGKAVVVKPNSTGTVKKLQIAILAVEPVIQPPVDIRVNWMGSLSEVTADTRGQHFSELAHSIYTLANVSSEVPSLSTNLTKALFVNIREQALLFLASVWTRALLDDMDSLLVPQAALFHAAAFLKAQTAHNQHPQDFQTIIPALLVALRAGKKEVRTATTECIAIIVQSTPAASASSVYALDSIYNTSGDDLQYLEWADLGRFVASLHSYRQHFINDGDYLIIFFQEMMNTAKTDSKKGVTYKERVLCYLLSHAVAWHSIPARIVLLSSLKKVVNRAKLQTILPLVLTAIGGKDPSIIKNETYMELLIEPFDKTVAPDLVEPGSNFWSAFIASAKIIFSNETPPPQRTLLRQLSAGLFDALTPPLRLAICALLVQCAAATESRSLIKDSFGPFLKDGALMASLVTHFIPNETDKPHRTTKRAKLSADAASTSEDASISSLTALFEILVAYPLPGSQELVASVLDALTWVSHTHSSHPEASYLTQLMLSVVENAVASIADPGVLTSSTIRMEILVEILRVSENPQTFNQCLLLIASLAHLAPEFVMQNVMPIFTFMGSNVFHRDDSYSFRVVEKTVDNLVPVVISSLKRKHPGSLELQKSSKEFLRVFTDASTHVPRHRRTHFFNHLVQTLGPNEFTVPVCLLLVDKLSHRLVRQKSAELAVTLALPLSIVQTNFSSTPFKITKEFLQEATRLVQRMSNLDSMDIDSFLELPSESDEASARKQVQAILIFVNTLLQQSTRKNSTADETCVREAVRLLLGLGGLPPTDDQAEISKIAVKALGHLLKVVSATEFVTTVNELLDSKNLLIENGALNLLASRLPSVAAKTRQEVSPVIINVMEKISARIQIAQDISSFRASINGLRAIAQTSETNEVAALTRTLPLILKSAPTYQAATDDVLKCILPVSLKIGPRILPVFREIVHFCSGILQNLSDLEENARSRVESDAQSMLLSLLSSVSQFWGIEELSRLVKLSLGSSEHSGNLRKPLAKKVAAKQILPALFNVWSELKDNSEMSWDTWEAFFDLSKRVIKGAPRADIHENLRHLFSMFLEAFDLCSSQLDTPKYENVVSTAFVEVVTKLNESTFKPLFHRLFDWSFNPSNTNKGHIVDRRTTFSRLMTSLIKLLKGLITPYMSLVLDPATDLLKTYESDSKHPSTQWLAIMDMLENSIISDEGAYWREDQLRKLTTCLVGQIQVCPSARSETEEVQNALKRTFAAAVSAIDDDTALKKLNVDILMQTRSEDPQVRLFTLECADAIWQNQGDKLTGFVTDVVTFIAECADDDHDEVAKAARTFKRTVEKRCGSLDMLMQ